MREREIAICYVHNFVAKPPFSANVFQAFGVFSRQATTMKRTMQASRTPGNRLDEYNLLFKLPLNLLKSIIRIM